MCCLTEPTSPQSLIVISVTDTTVSLSWIPPNITNGIITQYQLQYRRSDSGSDFISLNISKNTLTFTVTGLTSDTEYVFTVRAFTVVGHGNASNVITAHLGKLHVRMYVFT